MKSVYFMNKSFSLTVSKKHLIYNIMLKIQFRARKYTMYVRRGELEHVHICIHFCFYRFMKNQIQENQNVTFTNTYTYI